MKQEVLFILRQKELRQLIRSDYSIVKLYNLINFMSFEYSNIAHIRNRRIENIKLASRRRSLMFHCIVYEEQLLQ